MKKILTLLTLSFIVALYSEAQVSVQIPNSVGCPGDTLVMPIHSGSFTNIGAITLFIEYDPAVLTYIGHINPYSQLTGLLSNGMTVPTTQVGIVWNATLSGVTMGDNTICQMLFVYHGGDDTLVFGSGCEIADFNATVIPTTYYDGPMNQGVSPVISQQPQNVGICEGTNTQFSVTASSATYYQWQVNDGVNPWTDIPNGGVYSGAGTSALQLSNVPVSMQGNLYRCITAANCTLVSQTASLAVTAAPVVDAGTDASICADASHTITGATTSNLASFSWASSGSGSFTGGTTLSPTYTPSISDTAAGMVYIRLTGLGNSPCTYVEDSIALTIKPLPYLVFPAYSAACLNDPALPLSSASPSGGTYSGTGVTNNIFYPSTAGAGTHTITYQYTDGVTTCSNSTTSSIVVNSLPAVSFASLSAVCVSDPGFALSGGSPSGGMYFGNAVSSGSFDPGTAGAGTHTIYYTYTDPGTSCADTASQTIVVNALPVVSLGSFSAVCVNDVAFALTGGSPSGGTYSGPGVAAGVFNPATAGTGNKTITYSYTDPVTLCSNTAQQTIVVNGLPTVIMFSHPGLCLNAPVSSLAGLALPMGTFSGPGVSNNMIDPALAGVGTHTLYHMYTDAGTGCSKYDSTTITIRPLPVVSLNLPSPTEVCVNSATLTLSGGSPAGGNYFIGTSQVTTFNPIPATIGANVISYKYYDATLQCSNTADDTITVNALPVLSFSPPASLCIDAQPYTLSSGSPAGGTYSGTGVSAGVFSASVAGTGPHVITYSYTDPLSTCSNTTTGTITVNALPVVTLGAYSAVCLNTPSFTLSGGSPAGGTYTGTGITGSSFSPAGAGTGTHQIIYTYTDPVTTCMNSDTSGILVNALPSVSLGSFAAVCVDASPFTLSGGAPAGGTFSGTGVSSGMFYPATAGAGTHPITYSYTDPTTTCSNSSSQNIVVNALPAVSFTWSTEFCIDDSPVSLSGGTPTGGVYSGNGVSANSFSPANAGVGSHIITYTYTDPVSTCVNTDTDTLVVHALPTVTLGTLADVCLNTPSFLLSGGSPSGGNYSGTGVSNNSFDPLVAGAGTHQIIYTYTDPLTSCISSDTSSILVNALPSVSLSSFTAVCVDATPFTLSGGSPSGGSYSGTGVSSGMFNPSTAGAGTHLITYAYTDPVTSCINSDSKNQVVNALPVVTFTWNTEFCIDDSPVALSGGSPSGGTYSGTGVSGGIFNPGTAGAGNHVITYTYTDPITSCVNFDTETIIVHALPVVSLLNFTDICLNASPLTLSGGTPVGGVYSGTGVSAGIFNPAIAGVGTFQIIYTYTDPLSTCQSSDTASITVLGLPVVSLAALSAVCENDPPFMLSGGSPTGGAYSGTGVSVGVFTPALAGAGTHDIIYTYMDPLTSCTNSDTQSIVVHPLPAVTMGALADICVDAAPLTLTTGTPSGGSYSGTGVSGGSFDPAIAGVGTYWIVYSYTNPNNCTALDSTSIIVKALPNVDLGNDTTICVTHILVLDAGAGQAAYSWSNGSSLQTLTLNGGTLGAGVYTYTVTVTGTNSCQNTDDITVTVDPCIGLPELKNEDELLLVPNPANTEVFVIGKDFSRDAVIYITDIRGSFIAKIPVEASWSEDGFIVELDVSQFPPGVYQLVVHDNKGTTARRMVVIR